MEVPEVEWAEVLEVGVALTPRVVELLHKMRAGIQYPSPKTGPLTRLALAKSLR